MRLLLLYLFETFENFPDHCKRLGKGRSVSFKSRSSEDVFVMQSSVHRSRVVRRFPKLKCAHTKTNENNKKK